jgi:DNA-binding SARP family transcriptional activator
MQGLVDVEFRVLGPVEVYQDGTCLDVGAAKQRTVLAALLVNANEPVSRDRLVRSVWRDPPAAAGSNLRQYLAGLRRVLELPGEPASRLQTVRAVGYQLRVLPGELDLEQFNRLADRGKRRSREGQLPEAVNCLERALGMWRGRTLDGVAGGHVLEAQVTLLEERRLAVAHQWARLAMQLAKPEQVAVQLHALAREYPLRERLWGQLMIALCRSGRPAEALAAYAELRTTLAAELGTDPGPELRRLHNQILRQDDSLAPSGARSANQPPFDPAGDAAGRRRTVRQGSGSSRRTGLPLSGRRRTGSRWSRAVARRRSGRWFLVRSSAVAVSVCGGGDPV